MHQSRACCVEYSLDQLRGRRLDPPQLNGQSGAVADCTSRVGPRGLLLGCRGQCRGTVFRHRPLDTTMPTTDIPDSPDPRAADLDLEAVVAGMPEAPEFAAARRINRALGTGAAGGAQRAVDIEIEALWQETGRLQRRILAETPAGDGAEADALVASVEPGEAGLPVMSIRAEAHRRALAQARHRRSWGAAGAAVLLALVALAAFQFLRA
jgi:hypothetical protein